MDPSTCDASVVMRIEAAQFGAEFDVGKLLAAQAIGWARIQLARHPHEMTAARLIQACSR